MKCPKCSYVSHDYLDACRKCGVELVSFKKSMGLLVLQPGVLDLGLVLGETGAADLFASMGEEIAMHAGNDDDFEISLEADAARPEARHAHAEAAHPGARETAEGSSGLDHLTLELDISALSRELTANRQTAPAVPDTTPEPPTPAAPPAAAPEPEEIMLPGHMTIELGLASMTTAPPPGLLEELAAMPPPRVPETAGPEVVLEAPDLEVSLDSAALAAFIAPVESAEMAEVTPGGPEEPAPDSLDPVIPDLELLEVDVAVENIEAERDAEPPEAGEPVNATLDSFEPTVDDALFVAPTHEPSGSNFTEVVAPDLGPVDASGTEEVSLWTGFELSLDTSDLADEAALLDLAMPTLDDAALVLTAEDTPPPQPSPELPATAEEATPEDSLTPSDISALEDLGGPTLPEHLSLDLSPAELRPDQGLTTPDALPPEDLDATTLPGHLTLDLDMAEFMANWSSAPLDEVQFDDAPGAEQSAMPPPQQQAGDAEELLLDLDDMELDDDTKA